MGVVMFQWPCQLGSTSVKSEIHPPEAGKNPNFELTLLRDCPRQFQGGFLGRLALALLQGGLGGGQTGDG